MPTDSGETIKQLRKSGVVAVLRDIDPNDVIPLVNALRGGGITAIEITADRENPARMIQAVRESFGSELTVGAGTVLNAETANSVIDAGAEFVVSPVLNRDVIDTCHRRDTVVAPGVFTPTEAYDALELGADFIKVFPAATLGASYLSRLRGPLGEIPIMPTGGIDTTNASEYVESGAFAVGVGGGLVGDLPEGEDKFEQVSERAERLREEVAAGRWESGD